MTSEKTTKRRRTVARKRVDPADGDDLRQRIALLLDAFEAQMTNTDVRVSVADYIRLVQLRREFEDERPKDIKVTWVDSLKDKSASDE